MNTFRSFFWTLASILGLMSAPALATVVTYSATLAPEAAGATGSGSVLLSFDDATDLLSIDATFSGLSGVTSVAHIHCCTPTPFSATAGVAVTPVTLPLFPAGVSTGSYLSVIDLGLPGSFTGGFLAGPGGGTVAGARTALFNGLDAGRAYLNIHTSTFPSGEIRGFPQRVPEPGTLLLAAAAVGAMALARRRRA